MDEHKSEQAMCADINCWCPLRHKHDLPSHSPLLLHQFTYSLNYHAMGFVVTNINAKS